MNKNGIITRGVAGAYTVLADGIPYVCNARGVFRNRNTSPLVGDYVTISVTDHDKKIGTLHTIDKRKNELIRPPVANIDQVIITVATAQPAFNAGLLDRFLVLAEYEDIPILICVNKIDLSNHDDSFTPYIQAGYPLVYTSALESTLGKKAAPPLPEGSGSGIHSRCSGGGLGVAPPFEGSLTNLRAHMAGKTNVFAGPSGVGKSSLINALMPKLELETGEISKKLGRGKHTTRHSEIFPLGGAGDGYCVDTPGFSSLEIDAIPKNKLGLLFREFAKYSGDCKFADCMHNREIGCAVKEKIGQGIYPARYDSYLKML